MPSASLICRRNLEFYDTCHYDAIQSCDSDCASSAGELIVKIPKSCYDSMGAFGECCIYTFICTFAGESSVLKAGKSRCPLLYCLGYGWVGYFTFLFFLGFLKLVCCACVQYS